VNRSHHLLALGLVLLLGGAVLLLHSFGVAAAAQLWRAWPLVLLAVGGAVVWQARRGRAVALAGPERLLLGLILIAGLVVSLGFDDRGDRPRSRTPSEVWEPGPGPPVIKRKQQQALAASGTLELDVRGATIELQQVAGEQTTVQLATRGDDRAATDFEMESTEDRVVVRYAPRSGSDASQVRLMIAVPGGVSLTGNLTDATLRAEGVTLGSCDIEASATDIELDRVAGTLRVTVDNGSLKVGAVDDDATVTSTNSRLSLAEVGGPVTIRSSYGDVELRRVRGRTDVEASFASVSAGSLESDVRVVAPRSRIRLFRLRASAQIETSHGSVQANSVRGDVVVRAIDSLVSLDDVIGTVDVQSTRRPVTVSRAHGSVTVKTTDSDVSLRRCSGPIDVDTNGGQLLLRRNRAKVVARATNAHVDVDATRASPLDLRAERSTIRLTVAPDQANFSLTADPGDIVVAATSPLAASLERDGATTRLSYASGPIPIDVHVTHGLIRVVH